MGTYRIYIVEDDEVIAKAMEKHLAGWGYAVRRCQDFSAVLAEFAAYDPQLVLLDISLPFYNGYHWCGEIRKISKVPVIFVSSAGEDMSQVMAMNMGGDDFIAKPFRLALLTAKVQALLRRTYDFGSPSALLEAGGAVLNVSDGTLSYQGQKAELTRNESRILQLLIENKGRIVSREALMVRLWDSDEFIDENTLTVNIARLRKKIADIGIAALIRTKKGEGYIIG